MDSRSMKLFRSQRAKAARLAESRDVRRADVMREGDEAYTAQRGSSGASAITDFKGCLKGAPKDLSTNPKHLEGYGE